MEIAGPIDAWWFAGADRRLPRPPHTLIEPGQTLVVEGALTIGVRGLHASRDALDALSFARGPTVCRVHLSGEILEDPRQCCASERTVLWMADATETLRAFVRDTIDRARATGIDPTAGSVEAVTAADSALQHALWRSAQRHPRADEAVAAATAAAHRARASLRLAEAESLARTNAVDRLRAAIECTLVAVAYARTASNPRALDATVDAERTATQRALAAALDALAPPGLVARTSVVVLDRLPPPAPAAVTVPIVPGANEALVRAVREIEARSSSLPRETLGALPAPRTRAPTEADALIDLDIATDAGRHENVVDARRAAEASADEWQRRLRGGRPRWLRR